MELWQLFIIIGMMTVTLIAFIWVAIRLGDTQKTSSTQHKSPAAAAVDSSVESAFSDDFREELRNRARQQFEAIIRENAMFLQQDVRMSAAKLDEFMKQEIIATLKQELAKHNQSIDQTRQMLTDSLSKNQAALHRELIAEKDKRIRQLDEQMSEIVKKYVVAAVGDTLEVEDQLALIIDNLNAHKAEIIEDIRNYG